MTTATPPAAATDPLPDSPGPSPGPLLALDTSGSTARVALFRPEGADGLARLAGGERTGQRHSAYLLPLCHDILTAAGVGAAGLAAIACGRGPGSFTGLRVGLAVAKGLALPFDLPLALVSSLEALALDLARRLPAGAPATLAPVIDAGKGEVYLQLFAAAGGAPRALSPEQRLHPRDAAAQLAAARTPVHVAGSGLDRHQALFADALRAAAATLLPDFPGPTADAVAHLARPRLARGERDDLAAAVPSYGRPPDITTPRRPPTG
jgi:tRNA threonylcarbamoyladenosine biosynthesis protein TsaB